MNEQSDDVKIKDEANPNFPVWYDRDGLIARFRFAIRQAGGYRVVARLSGVPKGTIENLLRGTDVRLSAAYAIAAACKVSLDWLATGIGSENPEWYVPSMIHPADAPADSIAAGPSVPAMNEPHDALAMPAPIDADALAKALNLIRSLEGSRDLSGPTSELAGRIATAYDILTGAKR